jgi:hypothetical protein
MTTNASETYTSNFSIKPINILIMISHGSKITDIMKKSFNIDLNDFLEKPQPGLDPFANCDIFEIKLSSNLEIKYYKNISTNVNNTPNYIDETLSTIDFYNPILLRSDNNF